MHGEGFFYQAFIYLTAAVLAVPVAKRLGLGSVLGYLLAGIVIGPFALGLVGEEGQDVMHFAEFGVVMMLFLVGLELEPTRLWELRKPVLGLGGLQVAITALVSAGIGIAFAVPWKQALAIGMSLALSSTAIVLQSLKEKNLMNTSAGQSSFSVLLFQDIAVIPMLALFPLLASERLLTVSDTAAQATSEAAHVSEQAGAHESTSWVADLPGWGQTLAVIGAVAFVVVAGRFVIQPAFRFVARTGLREMFTAAALLLVIAIALLMTKVDLSPALGTFLAGVVLATSEYRHELEVDIEPFKGLLLGLFFIAVGASIDFALIAESPLLIAALVLALLAVKGAVLYGLAWLFKLQTDQGLLFAVALAQGGEFAFVLFSFANQHAVLPPELTAPFVATVAVSMALTPLLMILNERWVLPRVGTKQGSAEPDVINEHNPVIIAGYGRFGQIVGRLLSSNGTRSTVLDHDSGQVELLRKFKQKVFYGDASRPDLLEAAGIGQAKLLVLAMDSHAKNMQVAEHVRRHYPHLTLIARARGRVEAFELLELGVQHVHRETFDSALRVGADALRALGHRAHWAERAVNLFRRHDLETIEQQVALRQQSADEADFINLAQERREQLEKTLLADRQEPRHAHQDAAWDASGRRREFSHR